MKFLISDDEHEITRIIKDALSSNNNTVDITSKDSDISSMFSSNGYDYIIKCYKNTNNLKFGDLTFNCSSFEISSGNESIRLTNKESKVLELLMRNPHILYSTEALMKRCWNSDDEAEINVVWTNIGYLRRKIESLGAHVTIKSFRGRGYQIVETN